MSKYGLEEHAGELIADEDPGKISHKEHRYKQRIDLFTGDQIFLAMQHCTVRRSCRSQQSIENNQGNAHIQSHEVNSRILLLEGDNDWEQNQPHAGIVCEVGGDDGYSQNQSYEYDIGLAAQYRLQCLDDLGLDAGGFVGDLTADVNGGGYQAIDIPAKGFFSNTLEIENGLAFKLHDHNGGNGNNRHTQGADGSHELSQTPACRANTGDEQSGHNQQGDYNHGFLSKVHWRKLFTGDVFSFQFLQTGHIRLYNKFDEKQEAGHYNSIHDDVDDDVYRVVYGEIAGVLESTD